jgi:ferrous iron transport protein A
MERQCAPVGRVGSHSGRTISLNNLGVGHAGRVLTVAGERELKRRLLEMGFCNGARVEVVRKAPLGDPIEYRLRGYHLSLRAEQARHISIQPD